MGQKVNPVGLRIGVNRTWDSRWYGDRDYAKLLAEDLKLRSFIEKRLSQAGISRVVIERPAKRARITPVPAPPSIGSAAVKNSVRSLAKSGLSATSSNPPWPSTATSGRPLTGSETLPSLMTRTPASFSVTI